MFGLLIFSAHQQKCPKANVTRKEIYYRVSTQETSAAPPAAQPCPLILPPILPVRPQPTEKGTSADSKLLAQQECRQTLFRHQFYRTQFKHVTKLPCNPLPLNLYLFYFLQIFHVTTPSLLTKECHPFIPFSWSHDLAVT
jgi:hypothetical protein